jgi:CheY-like chemotaxis protein
VVLRADGADGVVIEVRDTGIGMTAEQLARIFEDFAQADTTTTRRYGGTGLGLGIVRGLAEAMGGRIEVDSTPRRGTRFRVSLPLPVAQDAGPAPGEPHGGPALDTALKVLAADDNEVNRLVLGAMLQSLGAEATIVDGARAAIEARFAAEPDVLLLDISMPEMDGMETLAAIRHREAASGLRQVPAIAVTANAMAHQVESYLAAGFAAHVAKPIRLDHLRATLAAQARVA